MNRVPMRTCVACRSKKEQKDLIRVYADMSTKSGRGAYLCCDEACLKKAKKTGAFNRALRCEVPEDVYRYLEEEIAERK